MPAQRGRKVAYLTIGSFAFLVASVAAGFLFPTAHKTESADARDSGLGIRDWVENCQLSIVNYQISQGVNPWALM